MAPGGPPLSEQSLNYGDLQISFSNRSVTRGSARITLDDPEWKLLEALTKSPGAPVAAGDLLNTVWGPSFRADEAYLATWIWRLRQKLERDPHQPSLIKTVPGLGYQLDG